MESTTDKDVFLAHPGAGRLFDFSSGLHPARVATWTRSELPLAADCTHYGFVQSGGAILSAGSGSYQLKAGMYFAAPGVARLRGTGSGFVSSRLGCQGFFQIGGPIESTGRLRYIDGCTDSLIVPPVVKGDPCLNLLHVPPRTDQTAHTHPSLRVGMIVTGQGCCKTTAGALGLSPGTLFIIHPNALHSFHTQVESLLIVAWHPDSDFGPTHEQHPMLNRTIVGGRSATPQREPA